MAVFLKRNVELLNTFKSQLLILYQNLYRVFHEVVSHFNDFRGHSGREEANLNISWEVLKDLPHNINKSSTEHFVSLIEDDHFKEVRSEGFSVDKIFYSSWSAYNHLNSSFLERLGILSEVSSSDKASSSDFKELAEAENVFVVLEGELTSGSDDDGLTLGRGIVEELEDSDGESGSFACARLSLGDDVVFVDDGEDALLLDDGGFFEAES